MKKRNFVLRGFNSAERICGNLNPSPLAKFRTADKQVSESRNHGSGSEVMTGASAKEFQDAGEGSGVRGNKAFTLAEVLITLVIAGVIGALTVPALIQNTQKQEYITALKKGYSVLSQAAQMIIAEEGLPGADNDWNSSDAAAYEMFKKYFHNIKECKIGEKGCMAPVYKYIRHPGSWSADGSRPAIILADGQALQFGHFNGTCRIFSNIENNYTYCGGFMLDVNGQKAPNVWGRDMFWFNLKDDGSIVPLGCKSSTFDPDTYCITDNTDSAYCTCKALTDGKMDY